MLMNRSMCGDYKKMLSWKYGFVHIWCARVCVCVLYASVETSKEKSLIKTTSVYKLVNLRRI